MIPETEIKVLLYRYVQIILQFEKALRNTYNLNDNPYLCQRLFPRIGEVKREDGVFDYRFHGSGCSFEFNGLEVHYDYKISDSDYLTTVVWKFWRFIVTAQKRNGNSEIAIEEVDVILRQLCEEQIIRQIHPAYLQYQISFLWFEEYKT